MGRGGGVVDHHAWCVGVAGSTVACAEGVIGVAGCTQSDEQRVKRVAGWSGGQQLFDQRGDLDPCDLGGVPTAGLDLGGGQVVPRVADLAAIVQGGGGLGVLDLDFDGRCGVLRNDRAQFQVRTHVGVIGCGRRKLVAVQVADLAEVQQCGAAHWIGGGGAVVAANIDIVDAGVFTDGIAGSIAWPVQSASVIIVTVAYPQECIGIFKQLARVKRCCGRRADMPH
ncbi:hypothetical protein D3C78_1184540 [compost metagenome]